MAAPDLLSAGVAPEQFRDTLSSFPTGLTVVTTINADGRPHGTTVSAFSSLSLDPPLVLVALGRSSELLRELQNSRRFGVNVLAEDQEQVGLTCGRKGADKLAGVRWYDDNGLPHVAGTTAWIACDVQELLPGGDHLIVVGLVTACEVGDSEPLIFHRRSFHRLAR
jgi:flavin reductase (DIM6/NTAB) family NADH-FMN oxidoreductase RutF